MKHLFKEGKYRSVDGKNKLIFESNDASVDMLFDESFYEVTTTFGLYEYRVIPETEYYYIFKKNSINNGVNENEIERSIKKILSGNLENVANENITLGITDKTLENDVFWDVHNNIIVVKGEGNLRQLCVELALSGYERLGIREKNTTLERNLLAARTNIPTVKSFNKRA